MEGWPIEVAKTWKQAGRQNRFSIRQVYGEEKQETITSEKPVWADKRVSRDNLSLDQTYAIP
jgi:hypothetical protein